MCRFIKRLLMYKILDSRVIAHFETVSFIRLKTKFIYKIVQRNSLVKDDIKVVWVLS